MKIALGVFQLDILASGEPAAQHRYCAQVVAPLLDAIAARAWFRTNIATPGAALEFLGENYPRALAQLRKLIESGQVELISATFGPSVWPCFPRRDLVRSVEINRAVLARLELRASRVFLGDGGLFGRGLAALHEEFDVALCKDSYLRAVSTSPTQPAYKLGPMLAIVGANHMLGELAGAVVKAAEAGDPLRLDLFQRAQIEAGVRAGIHSSYAAVEGALDDLEWHWYHMGGAHHLTGRASPREWDNFFHDPGWERLCFDALAAMATSGWEMATLGDFAVELTRRRALSDFAPLPAVVEGGWDFAASQGIYAWMGRQRGRGPASAGAMGLVWQSRCALRAAEAAVGTGDAGKLNDLWRWQILAESGRSLGGVFGYATGRAEVVLRGCAQLDRPPASAAQPGVVAGSPRRNHFKFGTDGPRALDRSPPTDLPQAASTSSSPFAAAELLNADGELAWFDIAAGMQLCQARFRSEGSDYGIRFRREPGDIVYCPSGSEEEPVALDLGALRPNVLYLPLINGFLSLGRELHLIRINGQCPIAAAVTRNGPWASFAVEGGAEGRLHEWEFVITRGTAAEAVRLANSLNRI